MQWSSACSDVVRLLILMEDGVVADCSFQAQGCVACVAAALKREARQLLGQPKLAHVPRPEDWPVMPVEYAGFSLMPVGFFDKSPAIDVPPSAHCKVK